MASPKSPRKQPYRILSERRPHLSLVSALNSWRSQRTEEQCTWSSFPAHHTSSTVCGEKGQCHHITLCLLSYSSKRLCPSNIKQQLQRYQNISQLLRKRFTSFCIKDLELVLADFVSPYQSRPEYRWQYQAQKALLTRLQGEFCWGSLQSVELYRKALQNHI